LKSESELLEPKAAPGRLGELVQPSTRIRLTLQPPSYLTVAEATTSLTSVVERVY